MSQTVTNTIMIKLRTFTSLVTNKFGTLSLVDIIVWKCAQVSEKIQQVPVPHFSECIRGWV